MVRKRGNGEGSITRHKKRLYMARYTVETATGAKRKTLYAKTRKEASERLTEALAQARKGITADAGAMSVGAFIERWIVETAYAALSGRVLTNATNPCAAYI